MHFVAMVALLAPRCFVVLFGALYNWIPLGTLNDVKGASDACTDAKRCATVRGRSDDHLISISPALERLESLRPILVGLNWKGLIDAQIGRTDGSEHEVLRGNWAARQPS